MPELGGGEFGRLNVEVRSLVEAERLHRRDLPGDGAGLLHGEADRVRGLGARRGDEGDRGEDTWDEFDARPAFHPVNRVKPLGRLRRALPRPLWGRPGVSTEGWNGDKDSKFGATPLLDPPPQGGRTSPIAPTLHAIVPFHPPPRRISMPRDGS